MASTRDVAASAAAATAPAARVEGADEGMTLMIDNYDSFTYNIVQYLSELGAKVHVVRNDFGTIADLEALKPARIVVSPGPGYPSEAHLSPLAVKHFAGKIPVLGVCLGHQAICEVFGGKVVPAGEIMHGKASAITHDGKGIFEGLPPSLKVVRYHSLTAEASSLPDCLEVTCSTSNGIIQGLRHKTLPCVEGVQFHPESILTEHGKAMLSNFLRWRVPSA